MHRLAARALILTLATVLSGCGVVEDFTTSEFAKQEGVAIVTDASAAMGKVTAMRLTGNVRDKGNAFFVDLSLNDEMCRGLVRFPLGTVDLRRVGKQTWIKGDAGAVRNILGQVSEATLARSRTKWLLTDARQATRLCDLDGVLAGYKTVDFSGKDKQKAGEVEVGEESELGDHAAVVVTTTPGGGHTETVWVSTEAPHYVLKLESTDAKTGGDLALSEFNQELDVSPPEGKDLVRS